MAGVILGPHIWPSEGQILSIGGQNRLLAQKYDILATYIDLYVENS